MTFDAHVLEVLVASPGDTEDEQAATEAALHAWNTSRARREGVVLLPRLWRTSAVPRLGGDGQQVINGQLVDRADIVIAVFDSRLGQATAVAVSGTAEEVLRSHEAGKPVHVWFSNEPVARGADLEQLQALASFKEDLKSLGLLGSYDDLADLASKVHQAIESDLDHLGLGVVTPPTEQRAHAVLRARYMVEQQPRVDAHGNQTYARVDSLVVENLSSTITADNVRVKFEGLAGSLPLIPPYLEQGTTANIIPQSSFRWPVRAAYGAATAFTVIMTWDESDGEQIERQDISA